MALQTPFARYTDVVRPEWIDYSGHMNMGYYQLVFEQAAICFFGVVDISERYRERTSNALFVAEAHVTFERELRAGMGMRFESQILDASDKAIDCMHFMYAAEEGYLAATWTAMEDVSPESGPLVYYPGSHKLPYYLSKDVGISPRESLLNHAAAYSQRYEPFIQELIKEEGLKGVVFTPKKGDMLIWHANLLHGGTQRKARGLSRKSVVCHYFARGAVSYHDLSGFLARPY